VAFSCDNSIHVVTCQVIGIIGILLAAVVGYGLSVCLERFFRRVHDLICITGSMLIFFGAWAVVVNCVFG